MTNYPFLAQIKVVASVAYVCTFRHDVPKDLAKLWKRQKKKDSLTR
jgi:hypothetical protein